LNATGKRKVPEDAPTGFVRPRWERHVFGEEGLDKRYYEMSAVTELKNGLKSGDVWVPGSRQYADFEDYLLPRPSWERMRTNGGPPVAINPDLDGYLAERSEDLHRELSEVGRLISCGKLRDVRLEDGELKFSWAKTEVPKGAKELTQKAYDLLPRIKLTDLLVAVDSLTGFTSHFAHLKTGEAPKDKEPVLASPIQGAPGAFDALRRAELRGVCAALAGRKRGTWLHTSGRGGNDSADLQSWLPTMLARTRPTTQGPLS
jgi:hypothetical protein